MKILWRPIGGGVGSYDDEEQMVLVGGKLVGHKGHLTGQSDDPER